MNAQVMGILMLVALSAGIFILINITDNNATVDDDDFNVVCLDGVEYWFRRAGYGQILAVKMTPEGTVVLCEEGNS